MEVGCDVVRVREINGGWGEVREGEGGEGGEVFDCEEGREGEGEEHVRKCHKARRYCPFPCSMTGASHRLTLVLSLGCKGWEGYIFPQVAINESLKRVKESCRRLRLKALSIRGFCWKGK